MSNINRELMKIAHDIYNNPPTEIQKQMKTELDSDAEIIMEQKFQIDKLENEIILLNRKIKTTYYEKKRLNDKIERLKNERHVYKIELNRCQRKLVRLYSFLYKWHYHCHNHIKDEADSKKFVDILKREI